MLDWLRQFFDNVLGWFRDIIQSVIDWILGLFSSAWDWIKELLFGFFNRVGFDKLYDYTNGFVHDIIHSSVFPDLADYLNTVAPWVPWRFLGWAFGFIIVLYVQVIFLCVYFCFFTFC